ncbi:MAG: S9 family peptidase [candidate division Zixibacteria bacterium]
MLACSGLLGKIDPPVAAVKPHVTEIHGQEMVDNYFWLRDKTNSEVIDYLNAENEYAEKLLGHTQEMQDSLYNEMIGRIKETDMSVPVKDGDYYYYSRDEEGKEYKIYCRKKGENGPEEIMLDCNVLAEGHDYFYLGAYEVSQDHDWLAYAYDFAGNEEYDVRVKDLKTGELHIDVIEKTSGDVAWGNDNKTIFYTTQDSTARPDKMLRHVLGATGDDQLLLHEPDVAYYMGLGKTRDNRYVMVQLGSNTTSETHYLDADKPGGDLKVIAEREHEVEYSVSHRNGLFYIVTNAGGAKNFKLMTTKANRTASKNWTEILPHRTEVYLQGIDLFRDQMVIWERVGGLKSISVQQFSDGEVHAVTFDEPTYSVRSGKNPDFNSQTLRFSYQSLVTPSSVYDYDMVTRTRLLKKQKEVLGGYDKTEYHSERIVATASDGAQVPISLVYKKSLFKMDGTSPLDLYAYGAYGANMDPWFSSVRLSLVDRGFVYAVAHIRGGGEMGRYWYDDGKMMSKRNTFTDFIACAEHLIAEKYTTSEKLVVGGGSAGGLTMGAITNMRPDLFRFVVASVPFVDIINTMLDESIPLTVTEWEEWGNPNKKDEFDYMMSYSPYDNVEAKDYPTMLITAGLNDPRVGYWEPAKWTAKLRATKTDANRLVLKTVMEGGHFGVSGRYARYKKIAFEYAYILDELGIGL